MSKRIVLFNNKGGVSKTTTTFNLAWKLAEAGKKVLLVDADPQCNLTGMIIGYQGLTELEDFYAKNEDRNLMSGLSPAFESRPEPIKAVDCLPVKGMAGLFILPGHLNLAGYEITLGMSQELSGAISALRNLPGSISHLLELTARKCEADYVLVDLNPSLGSINQNLLMTSDFFIVPASPDYFSVMAIDSLSKVIHKWSVWAQEAAKFPVLAEADYPFPKITPIFLGTIIQRYRPRDGAPTAAFEKWIEKIEYSARRSLVPSLQADRMMLPKERYSQFGIGEAYTLAMVPDFNGLIARSQQYQTPVFCLTSQQIALKGTVLERTQGSQANFGKIFTELARKVIGLTN